jgi:hypothetical protein
MYEASTQVQNSYARWKAFGCKRTLFLPLTTYSAQQYALKFFLLGRWQRYAIKLGVLLGFGREVNKSCGKEWDALKETVALTVALSDQFDKQDAEHMVFAMRHGSEGPYQKMSLLAMKENGTPLFYAKVAVGNSADAMVDAEAACLLQLSVIPSLEGMVPLKLNSGHTPEGRSFFSTSVAPSLKTKFSFESEHEKFLSVLGLATVKWVHCKDSLEFQFAKSALERLSPVLGEVIYAELRSASEEVLKSIGNLQLPTVLAHRDFSPWNIKWNKSGIFVFDWEYAAEGAIPLYDFFHFHLIQRVLSPWRSFTATPAYVCQLIPAALAQLQKVFPEVNWTPKIIKYLLLAYLTDLLLFYVDSGKEFDTDHPVLSSYFNLILKRKKWL